MQHEDGHSHILASTIPNCVTYDPTYAYELAVIVHAGLNRMLVDQDDVFYYITTLNENYPHPAMPEGAEEAILKGAYKLREVNADQPGLHVRLMGSGAILREVEAAAEMLASEHGVSSEVWSVTSFTELRREGLDVERWNLLHPEADAKVPFITQALSSGKGPVIASTDYIKALRGRNSAHTCPRATSRLERTASDAPITVVVCAHSSKSTATTSRSPV